MVIHKVFTVTMATTTVIMDTIIKVTMAIITTKVTMAIMDTIIKVTMAIMDTITTKVTMAIMDIINNKYITTATIIYIRRLFFIKLTKANMVTMDITTKANIMDTKVTTITKVIKANTVIMGTKANIMDTKVNSTNSTNNISNINNNNNLLLGQVELEQEERGQQQERLALVELQDMRDTWVINDCQKKRHNKKLLGNPSSFFQLLDADVQFQHEVVVPVLASLLALESYRRLHGIEASHQGIVLPCWRCLQFRILYLDVRPFLQTFRMQSK